MICSAGRSKIPRPSHWSRHSCGACFGASIVGFMTALDVAASNMSPDLSPSIACEACDSCRCKAWTELPHGVEWSWIIHSNPFPLILLVLYEAVLSDCWSRGGPEPSWGFLFITVAFYTMLKWLGLGQMSHEDPIITYVYNSIHK